MKTITLLITVLFALTACQSTGSQSKIASSNPKKEVRLNLRDEPQTLDPRKARQLSDLTILRMLFEGVTRVNTSEQAELALADKIDISSDQSIYTIHLRESSWSNGDPLKASDFVYAWKKVLEPNFVSDMAFQLYVIKNAKLAKEGNISLDDVGIRLIDDLTFQVELEGPVPYFLDLLAFPAFFPVNQKVDEKNPQWAEQSKSYVGNGPFKINEWKHQDCIQLEKNPTYWDLEGVKIEGLQLVMVPAETEFQMFEKNELDWAGSPISVLPLDALQELKSGKALNVKEFLGTYFLRTQTEKFPFNHPKIRKAFALAINRQAIVDHVTQGNQIPATGIVPTSLGVSQEPYFNDGATKEAHDLFKGTLAALKIKTESLPEIVLMYRAGEFSHLIAQALQQQWFEAFGIRVKLEAVEGKVYFDRISKQDFHIACGNWIADFKDPINFLEIFKYKKGGSNNTLWENTQYTRLLDESSKIANSALRLKTLGESEKILIDEMPVIPIFYYTMLYVNRPEIKNVVVSSLGGIDFRWAYFDDAEIAHGEKQ